MVLSAYNESISKNKRVGLFFHAARQAVFLRGASGCFSRQRVGLFFPLGTLDCFFRAANWVVIFERLSGFFRVACWVVLRVARRVVFFSSASGWFFSCGTSEFFLYGASGCFFHAAHRFFSTWWVGLFFSHPSICAWEMSTVYTCT